MLENTEICKIFLFSNLASFKPLDDIFYMQVGTNKRIKKVVENMSWWERLADFIKKWL